MVSGGAEAGWIGTGDVEPETDESVAVGWPVPDMVNGGQEAGDVEPEAGKSIADEISKSLAFFCVERSWMDSSSLLLRKFNQIKKTK